MGSQPSGLTLSSGGVLAGTPTVAATSSFSITGTDANGCQGTAAYSIVVAAAAVPPPGCPVITLTPSSLPNGTTGVSYSQTLTGSGGTAPYSFGLVSGGVPLGLTLTGAGVLAGTPLAATTYDFSVRATAANGCFSASAYTIAIAQGAGVPTMPQALLAFLAMGLAALGYLRLRRRTLVV